MILTHKATQEHITLEDGFLWSDEFSWKPVEQKQERAIDGTLIVQEGRKKAGRLMTLVPPEGQGWIQRRVLSKLMEWSALRDEFLLAFDYPHDKRKFNVIFNHQDGAIEAEPVKGFASVSDDEWYSVTLRFLIVSD